MNTSTTVRRPMTNRGLVGSRELVAIQTLDIARLTTHVTPIVPGSFIAISGRGPKGDSNGSGKTSFQAAVTVLLADPQWRFDINGGVDAAGLLFQAESAGLDGAQHSAQHGYIMGVFADPDFPMPETAMTVWVRLSTSSPHLVVRTAPGIIVVDADTDDARFRQADELWASLGRDSQLSARKMSESLYGDAPRCLAFLDTPLRKAAPSLLSQAMAEMTPADIGQALIDLAGLRHQFDAEQAQRGKLSEQERALLDAQRSHEEKLRDEDVELVAIRGRNHARELMKTGELMWRLHFAKRYVEVAPASELATAAHKAAEEEVSAAIVELELARSNLREIEADKEDLDQERITEQQRNEAVAFRERIDKQIHNLTGQLSAHATRRPKVAGEAYGWDGTSAEDAEAAFSEAAGREAEARAECRTADDDVKRLRKVLTEAREGRSPQTTVAMAALTERAISCAGLADTLTLDKSARGYWEAALWPWRDAIIIPEADLARAASAVAELPGTVLVASDSPHVSNAAPAGVHSHLAITTFLTHVAARSSEEHGPHRVHDEAAGIVTIAGFDAPITGRDARVARAEADLDAARELARQAAEDLERATARTASARLLLKLAEAAWELMQLDEAIAQVHEQIGIVSEPRDAAVEAENAAEAAWLGAREKRHGHEARVLGAQNIVQQRKTDLKESRIVCDKLGAQVTALNVPYWRNGWGGTLDEAQALLNAQEESVRTLKSGTLRRRASDALRDALAAYGADQSLSDNLAALRSDENRQRVLEPDNEGLPGSATAPSFADFSMPLQVRLDGMSGRDAIIGDSIERGRAQRKQNLSELDTEVANLSTALSTLQDMIEQSVESRFHRMSAAFDRLSRQHRGFGAELAVSSERPSQSTGMWRWQVTPRWRRAQSGSLVSYRTVANGAQLKVAAFHLTLSALIAGDEDVRAGQVLVIDELGNSLGDVNRKDVLQALQAVAESERVTILGVCQDSVLNDAVTASRQLLWFTHAAEHQVYNQPVRAWGFDESQQRVELLGDEVRSGRPWL